MLNEKITVIIPSIPPRSRLLARALKSVLDQTRTNIEVSVIIDAHREGPAAIRNRAIERARTPWVAFLDDDDEFLPDHLEKLYDCAKETDADVVYPWFELPVGWDPLGKFGVPFDPDALDKANYIPVTVLARTEKLKDVGGFVNRGTIDTTTCEDWGLWLRLRDAGAKFVHLPERTWIWHWHGKNTGGSNKRW